MRAIDETFDAIQDHRAQRFLRDNPYPYSGTCAYCGRERDDLFWHADDRAFYCAYTIECEYRAYILASRKTRVRRG